MKKKIQVEVIISTTTKEPRFILVKNYTVKEHEDGTFTVNQRGENPYKLRFDRASHRRVVGTLTYKDND